MTLYNHNRQLIFLENSDNFTISSELAIHKHHHPAAIIETNRSGFMTQSILCKNKQDRKTINFMNNGTWKYPFDVASLSMEK